MGYRKVPPSSSHFPGITWDQEISSHHTVRGEALNEIQIKEAPRKTPTDAGERYAHDMKCEFPPHLIPKPLPTCR